MPLVWICCPSRTEDEPDEVTRPASTEPRAVQFEGLPGQIATSHCECATRSDVMGARGSGKGALVTEERLVELKELAAAQFLRIPGVTAVGLGGRERDGKPTGEVVLKVFVERKRPAAELTPGQLLPPEFEGVGV